MPETRGRGQKDRRLGRLEKFAESDNIAADLDGELLGKIGLRVKEDFDRDFSSNAGWREQNNHAMKLALQVTEKKNYPWPGAANVKYPLLTTAAVQFAARAYPAIVRGTEIVKGKVVGNDAGVPAQGQDGQPVVDPETQQPQWEVPPGAKRERADRIGEHMSYQLLEEQDEWEGDTDTLLHVLPIVGCCFRKTYYSPILGRNCSELVLPSHFVVNKGVKSLKTAQRETHIIPYYPREVEEKVRAGLWLGIDMGTAPDSNGDEDAPHEFLEQCRYWDLDDDGYSEPYIVTVHKETAKVVRIVANYGMDDVEQDDKGKVVKIERYQYFTKFGFIPNPDGSFYDIGFGILLNPLNETINTTLNQMLDAGHLQNAGGGFIGRGMRIRGGSVRMRPGEYKLVQASGDGIRNNVVPLQHPGPSPVLFQLLGLLIEAARDITSVKDILTGQEPKSANTPATTTLAMIEQGLQVFSAIYKRIFRSLKQEYRKLYKLNAQYLDNQVYYTFHDDPRAIAREDYNTGAVDVLPAADPNMVSNMQRLARAEFLMGFRGDPMVNQVEIRKRVFNAASIEDPEALIVEQPPGDPEVAQKADEIELKKGDQELEARRLMLDERKAEAEIFERASKVLKNIAEAEAAEAGPQLSEYKEEMAFLKEWMKGAVNGRGEGGPAGPDQGGVRGVGNAPDNPQGPALSR